MLWILSYSSAQELPKFKINSQESFDRAYKLLEELDENSEKFVTYFGNKAKGIAFYTKGLEWAQKSKKQENIFFAKNSLIRSHLLFADNIEVIARSRDLLNHPEIYNNKLCVDVLYMLKEAYRNTEQFQKLIDILPEYHKRSKQHGYIIGKTDEIKEVAYVHYSLRNYDKAIILYKKAANELKIREKYLAQSSALNDVGLCFENKKVLDSAQYYYKVAIRTIKKEKNKTEYVDHFFNVLRSNEIRVKKGEDINRLPIYKRELQSAKRFKEYNIVISSYYNIAKVISEEHNFKMALRYLDSARAVLKIQQNTKFKEKVLALTIKNYLKLEDSKLASETLKELLQFQDSIKVSASKRNYMISSVIYETDKRTEELKESKSYLYKEQSLNTKLQITLIVFTLLTLALVWAYRRIKKNNLVIVNQKNELDKSLLERESLLKEIHHRVKNNLQIVSSLLNLQSKQLDNEKAKDAIEEGKSRVKAMALIHQKLYQQEDITKVDMSDYVNSLQKSVSALYKLKMPIKTNIKACNINLDIDQAIPIGLILNELLTNTYKYAFVNKNAGQIEIALTENKDSYSFLYKDDGVGLPDDFNIKTSKSLGMRLVYRLTQQLRSKMEYQYSKGAQFTFTFTFKV